MARLPYIIPPMSPMPPMPPVPAPAFSGGSATIASVMRMFFAIEAAFCSAERVTMVGSMIPAFTRSSTSFERGAARRDGAPYLAVYVESGNGVVSDFIDFGHVRQLDGISFSMAAWEVTPPGVDTEDVEEGD